ncbi:MAG: DUF5009 domain-containing protein [Verrucomicrobiae bacterium]|nr:DUF5009 domain-containing protein [Verrucomicrobiae bacterium]
MPTPASSEGPAKSPPSDAAPAGPQVPRAGRLASLDALRGFAMFWLLGGAQIVRSIAEGSPPGTWLASLAEQFTHVPWEGFRFYDLIFPLFLFCIGVAIPLSVNARIAAGETRASILRHAIARFGWMVFFGLWVNGNLLTWDPAKMRLSYSVLMMLGFGYVIAMALVLFAPFRWQAATTAAILVGYWAAQMFVPVPGHVPGEFREGIILSDWIYDGTIGLLGAPWRSPFGRGWPVTLWTHGATAMLGVFASSFIAGSTDPAKRLRVLVMAGLGCLLAGWLWGLHMPIVKNRWTSTYVLWCGGWSYLLLALFHWLIDVRGNRAWSWLFVVIGCNSILAYLIATVFMAPFRSLVAILFGGLEPLVGQPCHRILMTVAAYGSAWLLLAHLRRRQIFLRL